jgi:hypothetical protein
MSNRKLGILAIVAAVMVLWATIQSKLSNRSRVEAVGQTYLLQGLNTSEISSITVGHGDEATRIVQQDGRFVVANAANYPADPKQLNDLITKCLDIKTTERYTDNPKNHEDLEVTEEKAHHVIKFFKADGSLLTGVVVGKSVEAGQGAYVRLAGEDTVYLTDSAPWFRSTALEYVNQEIASVERADVNSVRVTTPDGAYVLRSVNDGDDVTMDKLPEGETLKASDAKSVLTALTSLRFDDVNTPANLSGLVFDHLYVCRLDDSTEYMLRLAKKDDKTYVTCEAKFADTTPVTMKPGQVESEEELKKKEAKLQAQEAAQKFTLRHRGWVYEIPDWKANYLTKKQSELLDEKESEEEATEATEASVEPSDAGTATTPAAAEPQPVAEPAPADPNASGGQ